MVMTPSAWCRPRRGCLLINEAGKLAAMAGGSSLIWSQPPDAAPAALRALATSVS